jgi:hypothetical protein
MRPKFLRKKKRTRYPIIRDTQAKRGRLLVRTKE